MNATEIQRLASDMKKNMESMLELHTRAIASIPESYGDVKEQIMTDLAEVPKHVENKDFTSINALLNKYANNNSK
jgi:predicted Zn-dependent protease with MMP-like domain